MHSEIGAGTVFLIAAGSMLFYMKWRPPGIAYTYCWLFCSFLAVLTESRDALALAFCMGFGLNFSWYTCQLVDSLLWRNLIPYWNDYFPKWCQESLIRLGDIMLHPTPLFFLLPYCQYVTFRIWFYVFLLERWYFFLVEGQPFGTGSTANIVYDFRPHLPPRTFLLSQYLTNLGYLLTAISQINVASRRITLQICCLALICFVCIIHTDRWKYRKHALPIITRNIVGSALDVPAEPYTMMVNELSTQLQKIIQARIEILVQHQLELLSKIYTFEPLTFNSKVFLSSLPKGFTFNEMGLITNEGSFLLWEKFADACASVAVRFHTMRDELINLPTFTSWHPDIPSLEAFQSILPNIDLKELASLQSLIDAIFTALQSSLPVTSNSHPTTAYSTPCAQRKNFSEARDLIDDVIAIEKQDNNSNHHEDSCKTLKAKESFVLRKGEENILRSMQSFRQMCVRNEHTTHEDPETKNKNKSS